ncbi:endothelin-converting enzyme 2 isoform X1 [Solenopsis invicta]|uniref:endothelin-converting enzyme 2 isoform X1 n=1 Tax=Solenopsis invicta TaxID=13686 RepID=UPI00193CCAF6|nr:endothelin-converting enzyme 2 isoform X1 [Solenopsis invicta]
MPFHKTYQINNQEQGNAAQRDQSYKSCLIALLIFFFMCLILIIACLPWKKQNQSNYKDQYIDSQDRYHKPIKEPTIITVLSTTQRTSAERTVLSSVWTTPKIVTTSTTITEGKSTEDTNDIITEDYLKKNVKGFRHFERYFKNKTSVAEITLPTSISQEDIEDYTMKEVLETMKENIGLATLSHDIVPEVTDIVNDATPTSLNEPIISSTTPKYATIVDIIKDVMTSKSVKESTSDSTEEYYSSDKLEVDDIVTNNVIVLSNDLEENEIDSENSTKKFERFRVMNDDDDNITISTTSNLTDLEENTNTKYSSEKINQSESLQSEVTTNDTIVSTQSSLEEDVGAENSTIKHLNYEDSTVTEYNAILTNETVMEKRSPVMINYTPFIDDKFSTTKVTNETEDIMNTTAMSANNYIIEEYNVTSSKMEKYSTSSTSNYRNATAFVFYNHTTSTVIPVNYNETNLTTTRTTVLDEDTSICKTGYCKQIASRMMSYMNHSADPCEDFYEYACGGFEVNPQLIDGDLVRKSRNYQRIASQMLKERRENVSSNFMTYYDSCVQYEKNMNFSERIKMANDALKKIGEFYIPTTWPNNIKGFFFTNLLARLILHHSAILFDVVPELDEYRPNSFTLKISPTTYESPFKTEDTEDPCSEDELDTKGQYVDLEIMYNNYKRCKNDTSEFMRSIRKALTELNVFKSLNDSLEWNVQSEHIDKIIDVIDSIIMQEYFSNFPSKSEMQEAYLMNNYSKVSLEELQNSSALVNWAELIRLLTGMNMMINESIQVYFHAALTKGLHRLEEYAKKNPMDFNNAIMGLYAHKLYHELVLPKRDNIKDHCLHVAVYLLQLEASHLYTSSFTDHEIKQMNQMIEKTFNNLKQTLSIKMQEAQWAKDEGRKELLIKINGLKLAFPVVPCFKNKDLLYSEYNVTEIILNDNYFNNSMILLKRYRTLMYTELRRQVGEPKQIWTYYATPFQSKARVIYALNLIVIPYGAIDSALINNELSFDYFLLATLGNLIAHQIAHHFDTNGIHYWDQIRNTQDSLMFGNEFTNTHFDDYVDCQKENMYQNPMNMTIPFTDQVVSFTIPRLTLNERLSEIMGLRLAYDTLALMRSDAKRLPWIQLRIDQLFYLAYAQSYCTKIPLTSSYVSLYESEDLPSRIRVFVSASNNKLLGEAWKCALGSQVAPNDVCSVFPYIETKETAMFPE